MIYLSSDWHIGHKNICFGTSNWPDKETNCRCFQTIEEMNRAIILSINSVVGQDDEMYNLGDVTFGGIENLWKFMNQLYCKNIHLVLGNHDKHIKNNVVLPNCHRDLESKMIVDGPALVAGTEVRAQELFKSVSDDKIITYNKTPFHLYHYPIEEWMYMNDGSIHVHGHTHNHVDDSLLNTTYRRIDVGWKDKVYSIDDVYNEMIKRKIKNHH